MKFSRFDFCLLYSFLLTVYGANATSSNILVTSQHYANTKMVLETANYLPSRNITKILPEFLATIQCTRFCALEPNCLAVNFCTTHTNFYNCELLSSQACINNTIKTLVLMSGCSVWDKQTTGQSQSCVDSGKFYTREAQTCETLRPGCNGIWPNCSNCVANCYDAAKNTFMSLFSWNSPGYLNLQPVRRNVLLWPGNNRALAPILGQCSDYWTVLMRREVDPLTGNVLENYKMSFQDINRLYKASTFKGLRFVFQNLATFRISYYSNSFIDENGTISNLTYGNMLTGFNFDMFKSSVNVRKSFPFVTVTNDRYGCGSFWLLDTSNVTYCPGGNIGMFGAVKMNGNLIVSTGIKCPLCLGHMFNVSVEFSDRALNFLK